MALKINGNEGQGPELKKKHEVFGYPSVLLLESNGQEIDRIIGWYGDRNQYFQTLKNFQNNINTLKKYITEYRRDPQSVEANYRLAMRHIERFERTKSIPYFTNILALDPTDSKGYAETARCYLAMETASKNQSAEPLEEFILSSGNKELRIKSYESLFRFYRSQKDTDHLFKTYSRALELDPNNADWLNAFAWFIYEEKFKNEYSRGIRMAEKAVEIEPESAHIWDTLGWLYFESGQVKEAVRAMQKAVTLAPDVEGYKKNLKIFLEAGSN